MPTPPSSTRNALVVIAIIMTICVVAGLAFYLVNTRPMDFFPPEVTRAGGDSLSVMSINVGNINVRCTRYIWKLCRKEVEERITKNLGEIRPELIGVQESLPDWMCEGDPSADPAVLCSEQFSEPQIRRVLGPEYTIVCDSRNQFECVGVRTDIGEIQGCPLGELCTTDRMDVYKPGCRERFSIMVVKVNAKGREFVVVNGHPESRSSSCRAHSVGQIFGATEGLPALIQGEQALIMGDMNLDPWRKPDESTKVWERFVGQGIEYAYQYHSGPAERVPPYPTFRYLTAPLTLDHVASNFLQGTMVVIGESPGTSRLDGGEGMDHRALFGVLQFPDKGSD